MFPRASAFIPVAVAVAVAANARVDRRMHVRREQATPMCDSGNIKCCENVAKASDIAPVLDLLSYSYNPTDSVGIDCNPVNVFGAGEGAACQSQPVCCSNNTYNGYFNVGCSPLDLN